MAATIWKIETYEATAQFFSEPLTDAPALEMFQIPAGNFQMGSPAGEGSSDEKPQHPVQISEFFLSKYPITQAQYQSIMGTNPATEYDADRFVGANRPVVVVSWYDAVDFCQRLKDLTRRDYRLPSEAEWEYACRAGTKTPFHYGETLSTQLANYDGSSTYGDGETGEYRNSLVEVGRVGYANSFGLCDMHGNVWEWCADHWHSNYDGAPADGSAWLSDDEKKSRLLRGGSWSFNPDYCRSACRNDSPPYYRYDFIGFRVVCSAARLSP